MVAFSAGLLCFTYSSSQGRLATVCCTIFTAFTSTALLAVALWVTAERLVFARTKGSRWVSDYVRELKRKAWKASGLHWFEDVPLQRVKRGVRWSGTQLARVGTTVHKAASAVFKRTPPQAEGWSLETGSLYDDDEEYAANGEIIFPSTQSEALHAPSFTDTSIGSFSGRQVMTIDSAQDQITEGTAVANDPPSLEARASLSPVNPEPIINPTPAAVLPTPRARFIAVARRVGREQMMRTAFAEPIPVAPRGPPNMPHRRTFGLTLPERQDSEVGEKYAMSPSRIAFIIPALKKLIPTQILTDHQGPVPHLQFSPDGKFLATCSWDRKAIIWKVGGEEATHVHTLAHWGGSGSIGQVAWSPDGDHLLTRIHRRVKVWSTKVSSSPYCRKAHFHLNL